MDLTKICSEKKRTFDWHPILEAFPLAQKSAVNPRVYSICGLADLSVSAGNAPELSVHPGDDKTLQKVCALLSQAVSEYYAVQADVTLCSDGQYFLQVTF